MRYTIRKRLTAAPLVGLLAVSLLAGCHKDDSAADTSTTSAPPPAAPASAPMTPPGPTGPAASTTPPGGPGGTMMNTPSANPSGGAAGDAILTGKVKSALIADSKVKAASINVDTKSNTVVLRGSQPTQAGIDAAMADAKKAQGVKSVINQLTVKP